MTGIKPGIYTSHELSNEEYHADSAISSTVIKDFFTECPLYCYEMHFGPNKEKFKSEAVRTNVYSELGSNAHFLLLEPEKFDAFYTVAPETYENDKGMQKPVSKNSNFWKDLKTTTKEQGKKLITNAEYNTAKNMADSIQSNERVSEFFVGGIPECSFFAEDPLTGLMIKARPDYLREINGNLYMLDYKSTAVSLDYRKQNRLASDQMRHIQGAHHKFVTECALSQERKQKIDISHVLYVTGSQKPPYIIDDPRRLPEAAIEGGDIIRNLVLSLIKESLDTGKWMGYSEWHSYLYGDEYNFIQDYTFNDYHINQWNKISELLLDIPTALQSQPLLGTQTTLQMD